MKVSVYRKAHFNAAHRLNNPELSEAQNQELFGQCNNKFYHGHNYDMVIKVTGEINPVSGYVIDLKYLAELVKHKIEDRFDHKNLNLDTEEFKDLNPTAENIVVVIYNILRAELDKKYDLHITLFETERNYVSFPA